jgi:hypothetical protein
MKLQPTSNYPMHEIQFNEYAIFLLLEEERTLRLKSRAAKVADSSDKSTVNEGSSAKLELPPRYQHLNLSAEWFISKLNGPIQEREPSVQLWKTLDRVTLICLRHLTSDIRKWCNQTTQMPTNQFQAYVWEAQRASESRIDSHYLSKPPTPQKESSRKQDLGTWFDSWFQTSNTAPEQTQQLQSKGGLGMVRNAVRYKCFK